MQESRREHSRSWAHSKQDGCEEVPEIRQIAASIEAFGFNVPVLVDFNLKVVAGHGRLLACPQLGRESVPTICLEHLSEAQARAFMIADNRLTEISTRDDHLLAAQLKTLSELELDFDLEATGFAMGEIDVLIEGLNGPQDDPADLLQEASDREPTTRAGDLWFAVTALSLCTGRHRLRQGHADVSAFARQDLLAAAVATISDSLELLGLQHGFDFGCHIGEL